MNCDKARLRVYAVTDRSWLRGRSLTERVEQALRGGATMIQLREKNRDPEDILRQAAELKPVCERYGVPLIINDSVELTLKSGADGVHLGQGDGDLAEARRRLGPDRILGASAHTVEEALRAERQGADYLGAGAVFPTDTKGDVTALRRETLREICAAVSIPVAAIGGITLDNLGLLAGTGISGVAVVSAVFAPEDVEDAARKLHTAVGALLNG